MKRTEMDIFQNSVLSCLESKLADCCHDDFIPGIQSNFTQNDMRIWMERISSGSQAAKQQSTKVQELIFDALHKYASGNLTCDKLINTVNLESLGFNSSLINLFYQHICGYYGKHDSGDAKFQSIFMSIFLNTHGVQRHDDLINALSMSFDLRKGRKKRVSGDDEHEVEKKTEIGSREVFDIVKKCQQNHKSNVAVQKLIASQVDDIRKQISETISSKIPFDETLLAVVSRTIVEPMYAIIKFEEAISDFEFFPHDDAHQLQLHTMMKSRNVNLDREIPVMRKELYTITLPYSWMLLNMDSTPVLDIILNVMLGCKSEIIRAFTETLDFTFVSQVYLSDIILKNIALMIMHNDLSDGDEHEITTIMIKVWKCMSAFIAFLGLFRLIFPNNGDITVGKVDNFNFYEIFDTEEERRYLASNCIYFHKGFYYIVIQNKAGDIYKTKAESFYELFYQIINKREMDL